MKLIYVLAALAAGTAMSFNLSSPLYGLALAGLVIAMGGFPYSLGKLLLARVQTTGPSAGVWVRAAVFAALFYGTGVVFWADSAGSVPVALAVAAVHLVGTGAVMTWLMRGEVARERIIREELRGRETTGTDLEFWAVVHADKEIDG